MATWQHEKDIKPTRKPPLIRRTLITSSNINVPINEDITYKIHATGNTTEALAYLKKYAYDVIATTTGAESEEIVNYLINNYAYDSLIAILPTYSASNTIKRLKDNGYVVVEKEPHELLPIGEEPTIRSRYDKTHD